MKIVSTETHMTKVFFIEAESGKEYRVMYNVSMLEPDASDWLVEDETGEIEDETLRDQLIELVNLELKSEIDFEY
jgi:hypothetical protein